MRNEIKDPITTRTWNNRETQLNRQTLGLETLKPLRLSEVLRLKDAFLLKLVMISIIHWNYSPSQSSHIKASSHVKQTINSASKIIHLPKYDIKPLIKSIRGLQKSNHYHIKSAKSKPTSSFKSRLLSEHFLKIISGTSKHKKSEQLCNLHVQSKNLKIQAHNHDVNETRHRND